MATAQGQSRRPGSVSLVTLKQRAEFLRVRQGGRFATPAFVLEANPRLNAGPDAPAEVRFGFTVSKRVGNAVERNRMRRRLKEAVRDVAGTHAKSNFDYVLIARRKALDAKFQVLVSDLAKALGRVHVKPRPGRSGRAERNAKPAS